MSPERKYPGWTGRRSRRPPAFRRGTGRARPRSSSPAAPRPRRYRSPGTRPGGRFVLRRAGWRTRSSPSGPHSAGAPPPAGPPAAGSRCRRKRRCRKSPPQGRRPQCFRPRRGCGSPAPAPRKARSPAPPDPYSSAAPPGPSRPGSGCCGHRWPTGGGCSPPWAGPSPAKGSKSTYRPGSAAGPGPGFPGPSGGTGR